MRECGLCPDGPVQMDGGMHRVPVDDDKRGQRSGAYVGYLNSRPAGFIQNFKTGVKTTWKSTTQVEALGAQDRARMAAEAAQKRHERALERERQFERTAQEVDAIWTAATPVQEHPYLADKGVQSHGLRQGSDGQTITVQDRDGSDREVSLAGRLLVPIADANGRMTSLQFIDTTSSKIFMPNGRVEGGHFIIGDTQQPGPLLIAEGYATAATLHEVTGLPVVVAFNAGNLMPVAKTFRQLDQDRPIYVAGDNDHLREADGKPNVGRERAAQAAAAISGFVLLPYFADRDAGTDWNDLAWGQGREAMRQQLMGAIAIAEREQIVQGYVATRGMEQDLGRSRVPDHSLSPERTPEVELGR
jgi:phage/plasmid primase-like uncharacterized protein